MRKLLLLTSVSTKEMVFDVGTHSGRIALAESASIPTKATAPAVARTMKPLISMILSSVSDDLQYLSSPGLARMKFCFSVSICLDNIAANRYTGASSDSRITSQSIQTNTPRKLGVNINLTKFSNFVNVPSNVIKIFDRFIKNR